MFRNREEAAEQLAARLQGRVWRDPLVLAIPGGGVVVAAILARELGAEIDVTLSRKLRDFDEPERAIGAISENDNLYLYPNADPLWEASLDYDELLEQERRYQMAKIARLKQLFRTIRPQASVAGRSVIVADDGTASDSTMLAVLKTVRVQHPHELIVALPVVAPSQLVILRMACDEVVCLKSPGLLGKIGASCEGLSPVDDRRAAQMLKEAARATLEAPVPFPRRESRARSVIAS